MSSFVGEFAALGTAVCWAAGSNFFAAAGRRMGSVVLNRLRITVAAVFLAAALFALRGSPWPFWATPAQIGLLAASGLIGFVFGDTFYFRSLVILGPGRAALIASIAPVFTAVLAVPILGEVPGPLAVLGIVITLAGIAWVLREQRPGQEPHVEGSTWVGVVSGVLGAAGQAGGYVISKIALQSGLDPLSATVIRVAAAGVVVWLLAAAGRDVRRTLAAMAEPRGRWLMIAGAFCGPFLGVTLSLTALRTIEAGVAASITAIYPVLTLLIASRFHGEPFTARALVGTVLAVAGVVVLFLR